MTYANLINTAGLLLDIGGVLLIWFFGLTTLLTIEGEVVTIGLLDRHQAKIKLHHWLSRVGMSLILVGFVLQLVSNFL